jgi:hypothetical protein
MSTNAMAKMKWLEEKYQRICKRQLWRISNNWPVAKYQLKNSQRWRFSVALSAMAIAASAPSTALAVAA